MIWKTALNNLFTLEDDNDLSVSGNMQPVLTGTWDSAGCYGADGGGVASCCYGCGYFYVFLVMLQNASLAKLLAEVILFL